MPTKDQLKEYRSKRNFRVTSEPSGGEKAPSKEAVFVIQKHDASRLHYDFRLEVDGVLKSWAVPKGPSLDPKTRRLAVMTEDHPLEYVDFEGTIPKGEYGAGTMLVWDTGTYKNLRADKEGGGQATMELAIEQGTVEVWLEGKKLRGGFALVRTGRPSDDQWLLIKMKDDEVNPSRDPVAEEPESVKTGRTLEEIARAQPSE